MLRLKQCIRRLKLRHCMLPHDQGWSNELSWRVVILKMVVRAGTPKEILNRLAVNLWRHSLARQRWTFFLHEQRHQMTRDCDRCKTVTLNKTHDLPTFDIEYGIRPRFLVSKSSNGSVWTILHQQSPLIWLSFWVQITTFTVLWTDKIFPWKLNSNGLRRVRKISKSNFTST